MLTQFFADLGGWNWILLGCILLALEILTPGVFLLWIGIAALLVGALALQLSGVMALGWQVQVLLFLLLSLAAVYVGNRINKSRRDDTDEPFLNQRGSQLIGRTALLEEPLSEGVGRVRLDDTTWRIRGPNLPVGSRVRVVGADANVLIVEQAES